MKKQTFYILVLAAVIIMALIGFNRENEQVIKVGYIGPLTGEAAPYGVAVKQGMELAIQDSVSAGLIGEGKIQLIAEDGACDGKTATLAAQKLINIDKVKIIFGGQCSSETLAVAPIAEASKVLLMSSFSTSPDVTKAGDYTFRVAPSDEVAGKYIAQQISLAGYKHVAILSEQTVASQTIIPYFVNTIGISNVSLNESFLSSEKDFGTIATKLMNSNSDALYMNVQTGGVGSRLVKKLKEVGYKGQIYTYYITGDEFVKSGPWVNGVKIIDLRAAKDESTLSKFNSDFIDKFKSKSAYPMASTLGYDAGMIITRAINDSKSIDDIKSYLYKMKPLESLTGKLSFDSNGDVTGNDVYYMREVVDNNLVDAK